MHIDVSNVSSIPNSIKDRIIDEIKSLPGNVVEKIKKQKIKYDIDVKNAIEDYLGIRIYNYFYEDLVALFSDYKLVCFHSTKVLNKKYIITNGIKTNEWNTYSDHLRKTMQLIGVKATEENQIINIIKKQYNWKYPKQLREPQLCFYSDIGMLNEGMRAGYEQFCENIGGELARDALKDKYPDLYKYLRENGKAYLVKFVIPFSNIKGYNQDDIVYQFISYYAGKFFWNYNCEIHFDGNTDKAIPVADIIELIPYNIERYYFNE